MPSGLHDNPIYQTAEFTKSFQSIVKRAFIEAGFDVTLEQFTILTHLWYQDGQMQQELAQAVGRDKTTISRVINSMISRQLIQRIPGKDKRERRIHLTQKGKTIQDQLVAISGNLYLKALEGVSEEELHGFLEVLKRMNQNLK